MPSGMRYSKRLLDLAVAAVGLLLLSPLILLVAIGVRLFLGTPVLFVQSRPGLDGRPFSLIKFRTMADSRDEKGELLGDAQRLTGFGRMLRSTSLDELPELWNVLKGDMSLVGPRPLLLHYLDLYSPFQMRRHEVPPGITGWAQVNGRNALSWPEKFALDIWYVDNWSFWLDLKILFLTCFRVVDRKGISAAGEATMPYFQGEAAAEGDAAPGSPENGRRPAGEAK